MAGHDGTGPLGQGSRTGRGRGYCGGGQQVQDRANQGNGRHGCRGGNAGRQGQGLRQRRGRCAGGIKPLGGSGCDAAAG